MSRKERKELFDEEHDADLYNRLDSAIAVLGAIVLVAFLVGVATFVILAH